MTVIINPASTFLFIVSPFVIVPPVLKTDSPPLARIVKSRWRMVLEYGGLTPFSKSPA
jgi:hypothetical protein